MSNNVDLYIQELETTKVEIKNAIIAKGVTPEGGLSSYADAINNIESSTFETETLSVELSENGTYNYTPTVDGYSSVEVMVDVPEPDLRQLNLSVTENGSYEYDTPDNIDGYNKVNLTVEVAGSGGDTGKPKIYNGFRFTGGDIATVDFSQYDWSSFYMGYQLFMNCSCTNWDNFIEHFNGKLLTCKEMFNNDSGATQYMLPNFSKFTKGCTNMEKMCYNQYLIRDIENIKYWHTEDVVNFTRTFYGLTYITSVPLFDTGNAVNMSGIFMGCSKLTTIPTFDTKNVITMSDAFYSTAITECPPFDLGKVRFIDRMFGNCSKLTTIPDLNTKSVHQFGGTSSSWLYNAPVTSIGVLDCDSLYSLDGIVGGNTNTKLTNFGGCRNLGKMPNMVNTNTNYGFMYAPNLTKESVLNILNNLFDRAAHNYPVITLKLHANHLAMLSDEEKAIATNKGWTLA